LLIAYSTVQEEEEASVEDSVEGDWVEEEEVSLEDFVQEVGEGLSLKPTLKLRLTR